jgi:methionyl-tRNA formyltransferase
MFRDERLKVAPVRPIANVEQLAPGVPCVERQRVLVGTATTPVELTEVQPHGKRPMPASDWARGVRIADGEALS